jgi:two-component system OmpR family sensor kinase
VDASRSRAKGGTGLGLSIVAAIVRSHRGRIMASHTPGGGLTTTIVLPRWLPVPRITVVDAGSGSNDSSGQPDGESQPAPGAPGAARPQTASGPTGPAAEELPERERTP